MSRTTDVVPSSRIRCSRCSRFVFRSDTCRCRLPARVYVPQFDGVMPHVRLTMPEHAEAPVEITAQPTTEIDQDGHGSTWGSR